MNAVPQFAYMAETDVYAEAAEYCQFDAKAERQLRVRSAYALTLIYWFSNLAVYVTADAFDANMIFKEAVFIRGGLTLVGICFCLVIYRVLSRMAGHSFTKRAIGLAVISSIAGEAYAWLSFFALDFAAVSPVQFEFQWSIAIRVLITWTWFFLAWAALCLALEFSFDAREQALRASELRIIAQKVKVRALRHQVNPHFLFNSLNAISALMLDDRVDEANRMTEGLSRFFRATLAIDPHLDHSLAEEFELQQSYLAIEKVRFPDIEIQFDLPRAFRHAAVPALILQPLVENAIKHGIELNENPPRIHIAANLQNSMLHISVTNTFSSAANARRESSTGIGLANVRDRLRMRFGEKGTLKASASKSSIYTAEITMPFELMQ